MNSGEAWFHKAKLREVHNITTKQHPTIVCVYDQLTVDGNKKTVNLRLQVVWMNELVNQPLCSVGLLHYTFTIVLTNRARQLVIIHSRPILPLSPKLSDSNGIFDLEDSIRLIEPADGALVGWILQFLLDKLPQMDAGAISTLGWKRSTSTRAILRRFI